MSEASRLGREQIETSYATKQIITAGIRVFFYLTDAERTLDSPTDKLRLWTGGDSLGDFPGTSLINAVSDNPAIDVVAPVDAHISTGLARPEVFNWPAEVQDVMDTLNPGAIAISLGSNDNQAMTGDGSNGASFGTPDWRTEYSRRVGGLMDEVVKTGRTG